MLNAEPVSFSEPFQDSIKSRLPINQAATRVEELPGLAWECPGQGRCRWQPTTPFSSSTLQGGREEEESTTSFDCTLN